jgi:cytochrome P450
MATEESTSSAGTAGLPTGCPVFHGHDPLSPTELSDPYTSLKHARAEVPVFFTPELNLWSVTRHEDVLAVLRDEVNFSAAGALGVPSPPEEFRDRLKEFPWKNSTVVTDPPGHRQARGLIQAPFTPRGIASREAFIRERSHTLLAPLRANGHIEFVNDYAFPLSLAVIGDIIGVEESRWDLLLQAVHAVFRAQNAAVTGNRDELLAATIPIIDCVEYVDDLIEDRRDTAQDDYTSVMVRREMPDGSNPSTEEIRTRLFDLLVAGFETSAQMTAHGVGTVLSHPDQWEMLRQDHRLVPGAVEEMLRYRTLIKRIFRTTRNDVEVAGVTIPAGSLVSLVLASANRDERAYEDADAFNILRGRSDHLAFGKWTHFCVGAPLARMEITVTVQSLLDDFADVQLVPDTQEVGPADLRVDTISRLDLELGGNR